MRTLLTSDLLRGPVRKKEQPFEEVWVLEIKATSRELQAYSSAPNLSYLQTLQPFLQELKDEWFRSVTNQDFFAGWGETQEGTECKESKNAMNWYWHNMESSQAC